MRKKTRYFVGNTEAPHVYAACQHGELLGLPVFMEICGDPVLGGRFRYEDGGWVHLGPCPIRPHPADPRNVDDVPECKQVCRWRQPFRDFALQRNALRIELVSMVVVNRCGWNLLPRRLGGHPLDYAPCTFSGER